MFNKEIIIGHVVVKITSQRLIGVSLNPDAVVGNIDYFMTTTVEDIKRYIAENQVHLVKQALDSNANLAVEVDDDKRTILFWAVSSNNMEIASFILKVSRDLPTFDINAKDEAGWTVLHIAASIGNVEMTQLLLDAGADVNCKSDNGQTPLFLAVSKLNLAEINKLIDSGAKVSTKDKGGKNCLHRASAVGSLPVIRKLLSEKAPINASDNEGWTALHYAYAEGHGDAVILLIDSGADVNLQDKDEKTGKQVAHDIKVLKYVESHYKNE